MKDLEFSLRPVEDCVPDLLSSNPSKGPSLNTSAFTEHDSDSDDPFQNISTSNNINFSRSRTYFDDFDILPATPASKTIPLTCSTFTNDQSRGYKFIDSKTFNSDSKNVTTQICSAKKMTPLTSIDNSDQRRCRPISYESVYHSNNKSFSRTKLLKQMSISEKYSDASTSPVSKENNSAFPVLGCSSKTPQHKDSSRTLHLNCTKPKRKPISRFQKYSIMKTALAAKKEFEELVKQAQLKKALKHKNEGENQSWSDSGSTSNNSLVLLNGRNMLSNVESLIKPNCDRSLYTTCLNESDVLKSKSFRSLMGTPIDKILKKGGNDFNENSNILQGVIAYVEIIMDGVYRNLGTKSELESLGAKIEKNFTKKVTHCFFHEGKMSTYRKAVDLKVPVVSSLWIEACKKQQRQVPVQEFEPFGIDKYKEELPLYRLKTKMRRPMTDSKIRSKVWKKFKDKDKDENKTNRPSDHVNEAEKLVDALHSVAGKFRKASHQFDKILKSPILKKKSNEGKIRVDLNNKFSEKQFRKSTRHSGTQRSTEDSCIDLFNNQVEVEKQLRKSTRLSGIQSSTEDSCIDLLNNRVSIESSLEESSNECRVSYDSDDLLVYAKKQAANNRCSAPGRLLTSSKCKKLLTSCQKPQKPVPSQPDNPLNTVENGTRRLVTTKSNQTSKDKQPVEGNGKINEKPKSKKRKLLANTLEAANFSQNSDETSLEVVVPCPYTATPSKKAKNSSKKADKHVPPVPVISDWESDDSITRARRESSALFVKKDKKQPPQRSVPTIVCTSLPRSEVEAISSIATKLGKFVVEATVSERTTHVVTPSPRRTINLLKGIARGCWILNVKWVYESLEADKWLHEEKYELLEFSSAVKHARLERQAFGPEFSLDLFTNVGPVYVCRATMPPPADLIELIRLCGGTVVSSARAARLMVGSSQIFSPTPGTPPPLLVKEKWVLDSISRLVSLDPYDYQVIPAET